MAVFDPTKFRLNKIDARPSLMGGLVVDDETNPAWCFAQRFGEHFLNVLGSKSRFVIFEKNKTEGVVVIMDTDTNLLYFWKNQDYKGFRDLYSKDSSKLFDVALWEKRDEAVKYPYIQIQRFLEKRGI